MRTHRNQTRKPSVRLMTLLLAALALPAAAQASSWHYASPSPAATPTATVTPGATQTPTASVAGQTLTVPEILPTRTAAPLTVPTVAAAAPLTVPTIAAVLTIPTVAGTAAPTATLAPVPTPAPTLASAAAAAELPRTVEAPLFKGNQTLTQPRNTLTYRFALPAGTVLGGNPALALHLTASDTLSDERSTLTLALNGETLVTVRLLSIARAEGGVWRTELPLDLIHTDGAENVLTLATVQRSAGDDAQAQAEASDWVKLLADSMLRLTVAQDAPLTLSTLYDTLFGGFENQTAVSACIVLDDPGRAATLSSMLRLSSAIGVYRPDGPALNLRVAAFGDELSNVKNQIRIGLFSVQRGDGEAYTPLAAQTGYLLAQRIGGQNSLTLSGADDQGLAAATAFALRRDDLANADTDSLTVAAIPGDVTPGSAFKTDGQYQLTDFGYDAVTLAGAFRQETSFTLAQPNAIRSGPLSAVQLHFRHSQALASNQSLLTVYVDGNPAGSVRLTPANANDGYLRVILPEEALAKQDVDLRVEVYHSIGTGEVAQDDATAWTVVLGDTEVYFEPGDQMIRPTLARFPQYPVLDASARVTAVLPDPTDTLDLTMAAALAVRVGQINGYVPDWAVASAASLPESPQGHLLFLGQTDLVRLPAALSEALAIAPDGQGGLTVHQGLSVAAETLQNKIIVQALRSPWNPDKRVYTLFYPSGMAQEALRLAQDPDALARLDGHVSLIDKAGQISPLTVYSGQDALESVPLTPARLRYLWERATGYPAWVFFVLLGIALLTVLTVIRLVRNKARIRQAAARAGYSAPAQESPSPKRRGSP